MLSTQKSSERQSERTAVEMDRCPDGHCYNSDPLRFSASSLVGQALLITDEFFIDLPPGSRCCPPTAEFASVPPSLYCGT